MEGHPFRDPPRQPLPSTHARQQVTRRQRFYALAVIAVFWNGIIGIALVTWIGASAFLVLLLAGLGIVGIGLLLAAGHALLSLWNPTVALTTDRELWPGKEVQLAWTLSGSRRRIRGILIRLEGVEEVTYFDGDSTRTDRRVFTARTVVDLPGIPEASGTATMTLSPRLPPSFTAHTNRIVWQLVFTADIPAWPDIEDTFVIDVAPTPHLRVAA